MREALDHSLSGAQKPKTAISDTFWIFDKAKAVNKENKKIILSLAKCFKLLGINLNKKSYESNFVTKNENKIVLDLIKEREEARKLKDFQRADNIRDKLKKMNINIEDSAEGTKWIKNE